MRMLTCAAGVLVVLMAVGARADEPYPTRPITIVNPFPPGGIADLTARPLAPVLERILKQPVVVANKAGAAGAVGKIQTPIAYLDADEFREWWDRDAQALAAMIRRIGKIEGP